MSKRSQHVAPVNVLGWFNRNGRGEPTEFSPAFLPSPDLIAAETVTFTVLTMRKHQLGLLGTMDLARRLGWAMDHLEQCACSSRLNDVKPVDRLSESMSMLGLENSRLLDYFLASKAQLVTVIDEPLFNERLIHGFAQGLTDVTAQLNSVNLLEILSNSRNGNTFAQIRLAMQIREELRRVIKRGETAAAGFLKRKPDSLSQWQIVLNEQAGISGRVRDLLIMLMTQSSAPKHLDLCGVATTLHEQSRSYLLDLDSFASWINTPVRDRERPPLFDSDEAAMSWRRIHETLDAVPRISEIPARLRDASEELIYLQSKLREGTGALNVENEIEYLDSLAAFMMEASRRSMETVDKLLDLGQRFLFNGAI